MAFYSPARAARRVRRTSSLAPVETLEDRLLLSATALSGEHTLFIDPESYATDSVLVRFRDGGMCELERCRSVLRDRPRQAIQHDRAFPSVPGLQMLRLDDQAVLHDVLNTLRQDPSVLYAEPNYRVHATQAPDDPRFAEMWGLENVGQTNGTIDADIDVTAAWDVATGSSDLVAVIDTGVDYLHEDLAANMWSNPGEIPGDGVDNDANGFVDDVHGYDFVNDDGDPMDDQGHGTHVAGTIGAVGNNALGVTGVNWNAQIMAVKFLDETGSGTTADAIRAIDYAISQGARISNNSWGDNGPFSQAMYDAIAAGRDAGHIFVAAAGNGNFLGFGQDNDQNPFFPASYDLDNIVSVAATGHDDVIATFSNFGAASVDLSAPGVNILSTRPDDTYARLSGTSMATPHVAGVASLLASQHPEWSHGQIIDQILATVDPVPSMQGISVTGGRLNAATALGNPVPPPPPPPSGTLPIAEDFDDGIADYFSIHEGIWTVQDGRFHVTPDSDAISTLRIADEPLPTNLHIQATVNAALETGSLYSNALIVFDYHSDSDFKFAGAYARSDKWAIGHRTGSSWVTDRSIDAPVDADTDYELQVVLESDGSVTLLVDGFATVTHVYADTLTDGTAGLAAWNAVADFDNVAVQQFVPPPPPPAGTLPVQIDFDDGDPAFFEPQEGFWSVDNGRYHAVPSSNAISTLHLDGPLPADLDIQATINAELETAGLYSNALVIFDYQSSSDFKFAGAYARSDKWVIGHRSGSSWVTDKSLAESIEADSDYDVQVFLRADGTTTMLVDGVSKVDYVFSDVLTDGTVGLGTWNALAQYDNVLVQQYVPPPPPPSVPLPVTEDFEDGVADGFEMHTGSWSTSSGRYQAVPAGDALSTLRIDGPLPTQLDLRATVNAALETGSLYSNALIIFDYQSSTDFKFAGAYARSDKWVIGHRTGTSWITDRSVNESVQASVDYALQLVIDSDQNVRLLVDGVEKVSHSYTGSLTDGAVGLGTWNAIAQFDDVRVQAYVPPPPPPSGSVPLIEDFADGVADFFEVHDGAWQVDGGRYEAMPGSNALSTVVLANDLPPDLVIEATANAALESGSLYSNALVIFDYQSNRDFKFAGVYARSDKWVIGHRTRWGWMTDTSLSEPIAADTDFDLQVVVENSNAVTLYVDGTAKVSRTYSGDVTDGSVGLGTWNAIATFDNFGIFEAANGVSAESLPTLQGALHPSSKDQPAVDATMEDPAHAFAPTGSPLLLEGRPFRRPLSDELQRSTAFRRGFRGDVVDHVFAGAATRPLTELRRAVVTAFSQERFW